MATGMNPGKAFIIYSGWLGDLVWLVPTIRALRARFDWLGMACSEVQEPLGRILANGLIDELAVDVKGSRGASAAAARRRAIELGVTTFYDVRGRGKAGVYIPWRSGIRVVMPARADCREYLLAKLLHPLSVAMPPRPPAIHMVDWFLRIAEFEGIKPRADFSLPFHEQTVQEGERLARELGLRDGNSIALNLGTAQTSKVWPAASFRRLAEVLRHDLGCLPVIMGARDYPPNGNYDVRASREYFGDGKFPSLVEKTDFAVDCYALQSGCFAVSVGCDSFPGHIAGSASEVSPETPGAQKAPDGRCYKANYTVSVFGPTNPVYCGPYDPTGHFNVIVQPERYPPTCAYDRKAHVCPHYGDAVCKAEKHCLEAVSVEQVVAAVENQLTKRKQAGSRM